jgi:hypothetical protein
VEAVLSHCPLTPEGTLGPTGSIPLFISFQEAPKKLAINPHESANTTPTLVVKLQVTTYYENKTDHAASNTILTSLGNFNSDPTDTTDRCSYWAPLLKKRYLEHLTNMTRRFKFSY